ncbi:MAG: efflux RND transporter permease subunit [Bacilli bacterium]|nr:efflux RND transporter permease subunit [Bacilli bacterium]
MSNYDMLKLEDKIRKIDSVNLVASLVDVTDTTVPMDILPDDVLKKLHKDEKNVIVVTFENGTSDEVTMKAVEKLRSVVGDASSVSGMSAMVLDTRDVSNSEMLAYIIIAVILCLVVLTVATDSFVIPFLLLGNIGVAILYNMGTNIFLGEISYITKAISAVLQLGVTMDFSIFLYHKYIQAKGQFKDKKEAMQEAITETFHSVLGSSLTTIAGFLALCMMKLTLGKDIGLVMAKGVLCGLVSVLTLFPALLLVCDKLIEKTQHKSLLPEFKRLQKFSIHHYRLIIVIFLILLVPAIYGNQHVKVYYNLDKSLPSTLASSIANSNLKKEFNIVSPEIVLLDKNLDVSSKEEIVSQLKKIKGIDLVLSPTSVLDFGLPVGLLPDNLIQFMESDQYQLVLLNSTYDIATSELNQQINVVNKIVKRYDKSSIVAGEGPLMKDLTEISDIDFKNVNYVSIGLIFIIMLLVLKSISLPVILISAIEFAILANMSVAFYANTSLPFIASIIIGTIQLGATIDYAILMSSKYLSVRKNTKDKYMAMEETLRFTVPSIIVSALCFFAATIGVGVYSKIDLIGSICKLLSRGSIISMLVVILILPSLLLIFDRLIIKTTKNMKEELL